MKGYLLGVFGSSQLLSESFLQSIAKKSETEGVTVHTRTEGSTRYCFQTDASFPERIEDGAIF